MYKYTYPVTDQFQRNLIVGKYIIDVGDKLEYIGPPDQERMIKRMHEYLGEAEHGGDLQELFREFPSIYKRWHELNVIVGVANAGSIGAEEELQQLNRSMLEQLRATYEDLILFMQGA